MSGGQGALSQRCGDPLLSRPKGCLVHVHSFITCLMGALGSGMVFGLRKVTDQEIHSLHPQKLSLAERHTQKQTITCASLQSTAAPVLFPKNQIKILTPFLKTLPGPPFTWSKIQSPYQEKGCRPVEKRGGSLAPPHLYVAPACFRALVYIFPSVFLTHRPLCTCHTPVTFLPSPSEGP